MFKIWIINKINLVFVNFFKKLLKIILRSRSQKPFIDERFVISRRTFILSCTQFGLLASLFGRIFYLQIIKSDYFKILSDHNSITLTPLYPNRGQIFDRLGRPIATNNKVLNLMSKKQFCIKNYDKLINLLQRLGINPETLKIVLHKIELAGNRDDILLMNNLPWKSVVLVEENSTDFDFVRIEVGFLREYHLDAASTIVGYLGLLNKKEQEELCIRSGSLHIGKSGIEKHYNNILIGTMGYKQIEVNAYNQQIKELGVQKQIHGLDLRLHIDSELQNIAHRTLSQHLSGSCTIMNIETGAILCLCSTPNFDSNKLTYNLTSNYWQTLQSDNALLNRAIQSTYAPGSIFKLVTVLTALKHGISPDTALTCSGGSFFGGKGFFHCWKHSGHGLIRSMSDAIKYSCSHYIFQLAKIVGYEKIISMAQKCGFGTLTGIDLPFEKNVPLPQYNKSTCKIADILNISIGQGALSTTPIQLLRFIAAIANNGTLLHPNIGIITDSVLQSSTIDIEPEYLDVLRIGMLKCVNDGGTAQCIKTSDKLQIIAGKTSTSQVITKNKSSTNLSSFDIARKYRNHAIFGAFAPFHSPKYAVVTVVEHGGGGTIAALTTKTILQHCMNNDI